MDDDSPDVIEFDEIVALALARASVGHAVPRPEVRDRLLAMITGPSPVRGFSFRCDAEGGWQPHVVPGIQMKVLSLNRAAGYATLLLDVAPGTRFPAHHHTGAEECYIIAGSVHTCGRRLVAGDFVHADAGTDHGELWTEQGCRVLLVVGLDDYLGDAAPETA